MPSSTRTATGRRKAWYSTDYEVKEYTVASDNLYLNVSTNKGGNNPFGVLHYTCSGSLSTGRDDNGNLYEGFPTSFYDRSYYSSASGIPEPDFGGLSSQLAASTNPSRPDVLLPSFIAELKDLPEMVKQLGSVAIAIRDGGVKKLLKAADPRKAAEANLAIQFGWRPFIQDLWTMATFADGVEKRKKELNSLRQKGGLRRTLNRLQTVSNSETDTRTFIVPITMNRNMVCGGTMHWLPTYAGSADLTPNQIRRVITGFDAGNIAANVWEELPWSWFTDYFFNVSQMLQAGNRTIATPSKGWIKTERTVHVSHPPYNNDWSSNAAPTTGGTMTSRQVERRPFSAVATASFPTLGAGQLSILGSLAVVKNRKVLGF